MEDKERVRKYIEELEAEHDANQWHSIKDNPPTLPDFYIVSYFWGIEFTCEAYFSGDSWEFPKYSWYRDVRYQEKREITHWRWRPRPATN